MNTFPIVKLADAPLKIVDGDRGKNYPKQSEFSTDGFCLFLSATNVTRNGFSFAENQFISQSRDDSLRKGKLIRKDIVLTTRGTVGNVAYYSESVPFDHIRINSGMVVLRCNEELLRPCFLYHFFRTPYFLAQVNAHRSGVAQPQLPIRDLNRISIPLPSPRAQESICKILSAYDDLIENNRRRMELLEASARHLYEEWFVRLRFPGHEHTKIVNGVPVGWVTKKLSDCSTFLSGGTPSKSNADYWDGDIPWISSGEMTHWRLHQSERRLTEEGAENGSRLVPKNTILAVVRGMSLAKEFRVALCSREMAFNQDLKAIVAGPDLCPEFLYAALLSQREQIRDRATEASHGTKKLDTAVLSETKVIVPPKRLQGSFAEFVFPIHEYWDCCFNQTIKLRAARDHLLPRLMNGELVVVE